MLQNLNGYNSYASDITSSIALKTTLVAKNQMEIEGQMAIQLVEQTLPVEAALNVGNKGGSIDIHV